MKVLPVQWGGEEYRLPGLCHCKWFSISVYSGMVVAYLSPMSFEGGPES